MVIYSNCFNRRGFGSAVFYWKLLFPSGRIRAIFTVRRFTPDPESFRLHFVRIKVCPILYGKFCCTYRVCLSGRNFRDSEVKITPYCFRSNLKFDIRPIIWVVVGDHELRTRVSDFCIQADGWIFGSSCLDGFRCSFWCAGKKSNADQNNNDNSL